MKRIKLKLLMALLFVTLNIIAVVAAPPQPTQRGLPPPVGDQVPIDTNILVLFASGIVLGAFFYSKKIKKI